MSKQTEANVGLSEQLKTKDFGSGDGLQRIIRDLEAQVDTLREAERRAMEKLHDIEEEMKNLRNLEEVNNILYIFSLAFFENKILMFVFFQFTKGIKGY